MSSRKIFEDIKVLPEVKHDWGKDQLSYLEMDIKDGISRKESVSILQNFSTAEFSKEKGTPENSAQAIVALQAGLTHLGFTPGTVDGVYGSKTKSAIKSFQKEAFPKNPKEHDGVPGPKTIAQLISHLNDTVLFQQLEVFAAQRTKPLPSEDI